MEKGWPFQQVGSEQQNTKDKIKTLDSNLISYKKTNPNGS